MNYSSTIRITIEKIADGKVEKKHVFSLLEPPYRARHWLLRYGGKRSKKYETITITELTRKLAVWLGDLLHG